MRVMSQEDFGVEPSEMMASGLDPTRPTSKSIGVPRWTIDQKKCLFY